MLVCKQKKFLIILPARCGTTSVKEAIRGRFRCQDIGPNHGTPIGTEHRNYYKVCLLRNPFTRVVSMWKHWLGRDPNRRYSSHLDREVNAFITQPALPFADMLKRAKTKKMLLTVCPPVAKMTQAYKIDLWARQENLAEELNRLPFLEGKPLELPQRHKILYEEPIAAHYDERTANTIRHLYRSDFEEFEYSLELP